MRLQMVGLTKSEFSYGPSCHRCALINGGCGYRKGGKIEGDPMRNRGEVITYLIIPAQC